jgi:hypothetical protein
MDLVGRKLAQNGGRAVQALFSLVATEVAEAKADPELAAIAGALERATGELQQSTMWLMQNAMTNPNNAGAAAYSYMNLMGIVCLGLMWLRMSKASAAVLANGAEDADLHRAKLITGRFYAERLMPEAGALRRQIEAGSESLMALPVEAF